MSPEDRFVDAPGDAGEVIVATDTYEDVDRLQTFQQVDDIAESIKRLPTRKPRHVPLRHKYARKRRSSSVLLDEIFIEEYSNQDRRRNGDHGSKNSFQC